VIKFGASHFGQNVCTMNVQYLSKNARSKIVLFGDVCKYECTCSHFEASACTWCFFFLPPKTSLKSFWQHWLSFQRVVRKLVACNTVIFALSTTTTKKQRQQQQQRAEREKREAEAEEKKQQQQTTTLL
jgi:hypothetical protein